MRKSAFFLACLALTLSACATGTSAADDDFGTPNPQCDYPTGAVEPMAVGQVLSPYSWPKAIHGDNTENPLDLALAPCDADPVIEYGNFQALLLVSLPAW